MGDHSIETYNRKRDFQQTPEPKGKIAQRRGASFVVQKHAARRLHYDFRLELDGVLKSWALTRGPSTDPGEKRLAVRTEDHPVSYGDFEGVIPSGYGAGTVMLWDRGEWEPQEDPHEGLRKGKLKFRLRGQRLEGGYALVRLRSPKDKRENWLLVKQRDEYAEDGGEPTGEWTVSVESGRSLAEIASKGRHYTSKRTERRSPRFVAPQLASLRDEPPAGESWLHELKYDGYRIQALIDGAEVRLLTRNGKDWTKRYPRVAEALGELGAETACIDGELVALAADGHSSFGALQSASDNPGAELVYYAFDLLFLDGNDTRSMPLHERKALLASLLGQSGGSVRYSEHVEGDGETVIAKACALGLEGIISKKATARYSSGRNTNWVKIKCVGNDEFVIGGYRRSDKPGRAFSSLLLGEYDGGELVYRGRVGTGFDERDLAQLAARLGQLERKTSPFVDAPRSARDRAIWVTPKLVAQIAYQEKTRAGLLRHPSFLGLREDKPAKEAAMTAHTNATDPTEVLGVRLTSPGKVLYPQQGATKLALANYYAEHAEQLLRYCAARPLSLIRCPAGRTGKCFFQKHHTASVPEHLDSVLITEKDGDKQPYLVINDAQGLVAAAQIGALELHIWGARADRVERPERIVFDLDPAPEVDFAEVRRAARELREVLAAADLESFALLTGGKGIHVVVPIERRRGWDDIKVFAKGLASQLAQASPERYVAVASKARRTGKIYIDWLRNERGATAIAPYSPRAREGAPVATPVHWDELGRVRSAAQFTLDNIGRRLSSGGADPWDGYDSVRQSITKRHLTFVAQ